MKDLQKRDLDNIWHPCSQMKDYEKFPPIVIKEGKGVYLTDANGKVYIDAISSWWVNLFGHGNERIAKALYNQALKLEHVIFANFTHEPAILLAEKILELAPDGLSKVYFGDNGSSAVEISLKLSFQYHQQVGLKNKTKFMSLKNSYHGETLGALSLTDVALFSKTYQPLLLDVLRGDGPDCYRCRYNKHRDTCDAECFNDMNEMIKDNADELSAIIVEPLLQGATGMKMYPPIFLKKLRKACDDHKIHLIADEISAGFGRTGKMFACDHAEISPDFMTLSKGLTAGFMPLSLVLMTDKIYDAFYDEYTNLRAFLHSHSYTGNPLGCSVALESLRIFEEENIIEKNIAKSEYIKKKTEEVFKDHDRVGEIRILGMVCAIELVKNKETKEGFPWDERVGYEIYQKCVDKGVLLRPIGDVVYFMPPYVITNDEIDTILHVALESIDEYFLENKHLLD